MRRSFEEVGTGDAGVREQLLSAHQERSGASPVRRGPRGSLVLVGLAGEKDRHDHTRNRKEMHDRVVMLKYATDSSFKFVPFVLTAKKGGNFSYTLMAMLALITCINIFNTRARKANRGLMQAPDADDAEAPAVVDNDEAAPLVAVNNAQLDEADDALCSLVNVISLAQLTGGITLIPLAATNIFVTLAGLSAQDGELPPAAQDAYWPTTIIGLCVQTYIVRLLWLVFREGEPQNLIRSWLAFGVAICQRPGGALMMVLTLAERTTVTAFGSNYIWNVAFTILASVFTTGKPGPLHPECSKYQDAIHQAAWVMTVVACGSYLINETHAVRKFWLPPKAQEAGEVGRQEAYISLLDVNLFTLFLGVIDCFIYACALRITMMTTWARNSSDYHLTCSGEGSGHPSFELGVGALAIVYSLVVLDTLGGHLPFNWWPLKRREVADQDSPWTVRGVYRSFASCCGGGDKMGGSSLTVNTMWDGNGGYQPVPSSPDAAAGESTALCDGGKSTVRETRFDGYEQLPAGDSNGAQDGRADASPLVRHALQGGAAADPDHVVITGFTEAELEPVAGR